MHGLYQDQREDFMIMQTDMGAWTYTGLRPSRNQSSQSRSYSTIQSNTHCYFWCLKDLLIDWSSRGQKASIYTDLTPISVSISISVCISVCTDMSRSPEAYPHTLTAYQTDLRLTMQVHMQHPHCYRCTCAGDMSQVWYTVLLQGPMPPVYISSPSPSLSLYHRIHAHGSPQLPYRNTHDLAVMSDSWWLIQTSRRILSFRILHYTCPWWHIKGLVTTTQQSWTIA